MARIIPLPPNRHEYVQSLLPWYVTGRLDAAERARVEAHLAECADCRAEAELDRQLDAEVARLSLDVERGWARMRRRISRDDRWSLGHGAAALAGALGRSGALGWALAVPSLLALSVAVVLLTYARPARYVALGEPRPTGGGDAIVVFQPQTSEVELRAALKGAGARIVDGPTEADAYVLDIPKASLDPALAGLRRDPHVVMAQPIDAGGGS